MTAAWVVPALDPGEARQPCLRLGLETAPVEQFAVETGEETLKTGRSAISFDSDQIRFPGTYLVFARWTSMN